MKNKTKSIPDVQTFLKNFYPDVYYGKINANDGMISAIEIDYFNRYGKTIYLVYALGGLNND